MPSNLKRRRDCEANNHVPKVCGYSTNTYLTKSRRSDCHRWKMIAPRPWVRQPMITGRIKQVNLRALTMISIIFRASVVAPWLAKNRGTVFVVPREVGHISLQQERRSQL
jgi:hypothetical protein